MNRLKRLRVEGFKSFREAELEFGNLTVLIGANGAGKSNFVSLFQMLRASMEGELQQWVGKQGGGNAILHYGARTTPRMSFDLQYETGVGVNRYHARLVHAASDTLVYDGEGLTFTNAPHGSPATAVQKSFGSGHKESAVVEAGQTGNKAVAAANASLLKWRHYQFHDTSPVAGIRMKRYVHDNRYLRGDAGNLCAYLFAMREKKRAHYDRIVNTIRLAAPFFGDFDLGLLDDERSVMLNWRESGRDMLFGPHQLSDGTLRFMALTTLLQQPREDLPSLMIIDEPELGLHPFAIAVLGGMIRSVSKACQVVLATQSVSLIDEFEPSDIVVVDRHEGESTFNRLDPEKLEDWLANYSVSQLWEKNVLGGRPAR
jgi:predicted ATPase